MKVVCRLHQLGGPVRLHHTVSGSSSSVEDGWVGEAETVEFQRSRVVCLVLHHGSVGCADPVADVEMGAIGKGEGGEDLAAGTYYGGWRWGS